MIVNRRVVGSSPTCGANLFSEIRAADGLPVHMFPIIFPVSHFSQLPRSHCNVQRYSSHTILTGDALAGLAVAVNHLSAFIAITPNQVSITFAAGD